MIAKTMKDIANFKKVYTIERLWGGIQGNADRTIDGEMTTKCTGCSGAGACRQERRGRCA
jgi:hypothetical protein